jgi:hypothetical protein
MVALFLLLVIVALALGIVGVIAKGLYRVRDLVVRRGEMAPDPRRSPG